jgi:hypothetical protein
VRPQARLHANLGAASNDASIVYVACNQSNDIVAVNTRDWTLARRLPAGNGVYNLAMSKDGRQIATNKSAQSVSRGVGAPC